MGRNELVWYVAYGSNMCRERLMCYLRGGRPPRARRDYPGARDHAAPRADAPVDLPGRIYFAGTSSVWGGGMAFYDHDLRAAATSTPARAYLVTVPQLADLAAQEMHRRPVGGDPLERAVEHGLAAGRYAAGPGRYETVVQVGRRDEIPMLTFTAPGGANDVPHTLPQAAYLGMLARGLRESHGWDEERIRAYFEAVTGPAPDDPAVKRGCTRRRRRPPSPS